MDQKLVACLNIYLLLESWAFALPRHWRITKQIDAGCGGANVKRKCGDDWQEFVPQNKRMAENVMCYLWVAGRLFDVMARRPTRREVVGLVPSRHCSTCSALPALYICVQYTNEKN